MQINYIQLTDFKSFRGTHQVGPFENITAVIGPNGSGKSNIIDSLCFVFNVENARNDNPISSFKEGSRPQQCIVEIFLENTQKNYERVSFKKIQTRKRQFMYYYNNNELSEEEYVDQLSLFKIGPEIFMLQGESDKLIKKDPLEMSLLIERSCGSIQYKNEYEEIEEKIRNINQEIMTIVQQQRNQKKEGIKLKSLSEQTEKYLKLNEEIRKLQTKNELCSLAKIDSETHDIINGLQSNSQQLEQQGQQKKKFQIKLQQNDAQIKQLKSNISQKEKDLQAVKQTLSDISNEISVEEEKFKNTPVHQPNHILQQQLNEQIKQGEIQIKQLYGELQKAEQDLKEMQSQEKIKSQIENKKIKQNYEEYQQLVKSCNEQTLTHQQELKKLNQDLQNANQQHKIEMEMFNKSNLQIQDLQNKIEENKTLKMQKEQNLENFIQKNAYLKEKIKNLEKERQQSLQKLQKLENQLNNFNDQKYLLELEIENSQEIQNQAKIYRELSKIQGFYGEFSSLIRCTNKNYELACKIALGGHLNCLVVDTLQTAQLINIALQEKGISREVMILQNLPEYQQTKISKSQMSNLGENIQEFVDIDIQNLKYNENNRLQTQIQNVLQYMLKGKVVSDSNEKAFELRKKKLKQIYQIITKEGNIFSNDNCITSSGDKQQYLKKTLGTDKEIQDLQLKINKLDEQISSLNQDIEQIKEGNEEKDYNQLLEEIQQQERKVETTKNEIKGIDEKISAIEQKKQQIYNLAQNSLEVQKYEEIIKEAEKNINQVQKTINETKNEVFKQFSVKHKIDIKELTTALVDNVERVFQNIEKQQFKINQIQEKISQYESKNQKTAKALKTFNDNVENYKKTEEIYKILIQEKIQLKESENKKYKDKLEEINELKDQLQEKKLQNDEYFSEIITKKKNLQKERIQLKHQLSLLIEKKEQQIQECQIKQIFDVFVEKQQKYSQKIPHFSQEEDEQNYQDVIQQKINELDLIDYSLLYDDKDLILKKSDFWEEYDDKIEFLLKNIDFKYLESYQRDIQRQLEKKKEEIQEYTSREITEGILGGQIGLSDEIKEKKETLKKKFNELLAQKKENEDKFKQIKSKRKEIFDQFFKDIQELVKQYYGELTKLPGKKQGQKGAVDLTVSNEEEKYKGGINYFCCPPNKTYSLNPEKELSGGEKAIAQMALYLALAKDTPFLILDEAEASLDLVNSINVIDTLKALLSQKQKIIVSHKSEIYSKCDSLVGITIDRDNQTSTCFSLLLQE